MCEVDNSDDDVSYIDEPGNIQCSDHHDAPNKIYKRRWFMLFIFALNCIGNAINFTTLAGINRIACIYYKVEPDVLNWIPNSFLLVFVFVGLPSAYVISSLGLRRSLIIGSSLNAIACCLHFAGNRPDGFAYVMAGQISAAVGVGAFLQVPGKLATIWFSVDEHATATSIGYLVNVLGMAIGYVQSTQMVPSTSQNMAAVADGIFYMNLSQMIFVLVVLVFTYIAFQEKPPSPSSNLVTSVNEGNCKAPPFMTCLRLLAGDRDYNLYSQAFAICFGVFVFYSIVLNEMVSKRMKEGDIGWMGFSCNMFGIVGMLSCGIIVDKYKCYKLMSTFLVVGSLLDWIAFTLILLLTNSTVVLFFIYSLFGFFTIPLASVGVEQSSVTTYPVPEETSGGIMLIIGNLYGFVLVLLLGELVQQDKIAIVCYITIGLFAVALLFVSVSRVKLKKLNAEYHHVEATGSLDQVA